MEPGSHATTMVYRVVLQGLAVALALSLASCAAKKAYPVSMVQPQDDKRTCAEIDSEIAHNEKEALRKVGMDEDVVDQNIAVGVVGAMVLWPALFALDLSNKDQIELRALQDRNEHLGTLRHKRECPSPES